MSQNYNTNKRKGYTKPPSLSDKGMINIQNQKQKIIKNDIKTNPKRKKSYSNIKSPVNVPNSLPMNKKQIPKKGTIATVSDTRKENQSNKKIGLLQIDKAIRFIQKNIRIFLNKLHSSNKMKDILKKKKMGILRNYNLIAQDDLNENPLFEQPSKITNEKEINIKDNELDIQQQEIIEHDKKLYDIAYHQYNNNNELNEVKKEFDYDDINEEIKNSYNNEENKELKMNEKNKLKNINNKFNLKEKNEEEENGLEDKQIGKVENIYEKIFREMQKEKKKEKTKEKENEKENENDKELSKNSQLKKEENLLLIKDDIIENELIIQNNQQNTNIINEPKIPQDDMNIEDINENQEELYETIPKENIELSKRISHNQNEEFSNSKNINEENIQQHLIRKNESIINSSLISQNKKKTQSKNEVYNRLANFLDESTSQNYPNPTSIQQQFNTENKTQPPIGNLGNYINDTQIQSDNIGLTLELKESKKTIETMTKVITELKSQLKAKDDYLNKALLNQKNENDLALNRQNTLMESLYSEKKKLEAQISDLQEKLNQNEKVSYKKLQSMRENYELESKKNKDAWFQAEKLRRKKWEEQKIKEIKDLTAKGLEPEIERIISNHKAEIANLEDQYMKDLKIQKERLIEDYDEKISEMKKRLIKEKEEAIEHEKNLTVQRLRNQSERLEDEISEERRRWNLKMQNEISRLESLREKDKKIYEDQIAKLEERNNNNIFSNENHYQTKLEQIKKDYDEKLSNEITNIKMSLEKENEKILDQKRIEIEKKFKEMKLELLKDRDKQINTVIEKLGEETLNERKKHLSECEKKANEKNLALIEENGQMKKKLNDLTEKLQAETKNRINLEENIEILAKKLKDKEKELDKKEKKLNDISQNYNEVTDKLTGLTRDFNKEKMNLEIEMKSHLQKGDAEIALLNNKLQTAQKLLEQQKEEMENLHRKEIEEIEKKIKKSFQRKDEIIQKLQEEIELKEITIQKYEEMINQQRKELFGKI